jgi:hypothetical protein
MDLKWDKVKRQCHVHHPYAECLHVTIRPFQDTLWIMSTWRWCVGIVTQVWAPWLRNRDFRFLAGGKRFIYFPKHPHQLWSPPSLQLVRWTLYLGTKQPGSEGGHTSPSNVEAKNERNYTSTLPYTFTACIGATLFSLTEKSGMRKLLSAIPFRRKTLRVYYNTLQCHFWSWSGKRCHVQCNECRV